MVICSQLFCRLTDIGAITEGVKLNPLIAPRKGAKDFPPNTAVVPVREQGGGGGTLDGPVRVTGGLPWLREPLLQKEADRSRPGTGLPDLVITQGCRHKFGERDIVGMLGDESFQGLTAFTPLQVSVVEDLRDGVAAVWTGHDDRPLVKCVSVTALLRSHGRKNLGQHHAMEKIYCVTSPFLTGCKIGCWEGTVKDLVNRYRTPYGIVDAVVYACTDRRRREKEVHAVCKECRLVGELYKLDAIPLFHTYGQSQCSDSVTWENTTYVARATCIRKKRKREARAAEEKTRLAEAEKLNMEIATKLDVFIFDICDTGAALRVNAAALKNAYIKAVGRKMKQNDFQKAMAERGFVYKVAKVNGKTEKIYTGLCLQSL